MTYINNTKIDDGLPKIQLGEWDRIWICYDKIPIGGLYLNGLMLWDGAVKLHTIHPLEIPHLIKAEYFNTGLILVETLSGTLVLLDNEWKDYDNLVGKTKKW